MSANVVVHASCSLCAHKFFPQRMTTPIQSQDRDLYDLIFSVIFQHFLWKQAVEFQGFSGNSHWAETDECRANKYDQSWRTRERVKLCSEKGEWGNLHRGPPRVMVAGKFCWGDLGVFILERSVLTWDKVFSIRTLRPWFFIHCWNCNSAECAVRWWIQHSDNIITNRGDSRYPWRLAEHLMI